MNYSDELGALKTRQGIAEQQAGMMGGCQAATNGRSYVINDHAYRVPLKEQLEKSAADADDVRRRQQRAYDILTRHPEFEEFLELQDIINRGLWR